MRRYAVSVLLAACAAGLVYTWVTTGAPMAFVYYGYPLLLSVAAATLVVLVFGISCTLTKRPRSSSLGIAALFFVATFVFVTARANEFLGHLWWRAFIFYAVFIFIPPVVGAISTWTAAARRLRPDRSD